MADTEPDFPFWRFSLALYGQPGLPELCVGLQDAHGIDVNVLFYLLFRAREGTAFDASDIARLDAALAPWRAEVVQPLRQVRRALKRAEIAGLARDEDALRNQVKAVELRAEKLQQRALDRIGTEIAATKRTALDPEDAVRRAWRAYATHLGAVLPDGALRDILDALAAVANGREP